MTKANYSRPPGRPRDPELEDQILEAARTRLVGDGYSRMSISEVAADAGTTRPSVYRRWKSKQDLVVATFERGYELQMARLGRPELDSLTGFEGFRALIGHADPRCFDERTHLLHGTIISEAEREPEVLYALREFAILPRLEDFRRGVSQLQASNKLRHQIDVDFLYRLVIGSFYGDILAGESGTHFQFCDSLARELWPLVSPDNQTSAGTR